MTAPTPARPGRNEPCHCGSGRKYKQCCLPNDELLAATARKAQAEEAAASELPAEGVAAAAPRTPKHHTQQPWRNTTSRGFVPRSTTPRKAGGS
ncbi:MAG TPA: SEC-C metal-binding domain-containing protein [Vicinamibacterales bacterium]|nr:SEC-C metal-binding domain-containing protein [Vicinamibacterales bacterium]